jgi:putative ABC transport system permease protein
MESLLQDLRYGFRMMLKAPGVTAVVIITIALGIGANTAVFTVIDAVLIRPLTFPEPERLVVVGIQQPGDNSQYPPLGDADFLAWRDRQTTLEDVAAFYLGNYSLTGHGLPERIRGARVTADFFSVLKSAPALGRTFRPDEGVAGAAPVVVVSQSFWRSHLDSDPQAVGRSIVLDGKARTVIGVMPAEFHFPRPDRNDVWTLIDIPTPMARPPYYLTGFGRMKPGATSSQVQAELTSIATQVTEQFPTSHYERTSVVPLKEYLLGDVRLPLLVVSGAVAFVLLIALVNVANLLLAKATARRREMAVRQALGAGRMRLARQVLTESVLLASIGGAAGLLLAKWSIDSFVAFEPTYIPRLAEVALNARVMFFTAIMSIVTGILFGLVPALSGLSSSLNETLQAGTRWSASTPGQQTRRLLVICEFALSLMLVTGAGLLLRSLDRLQRVNVGFDTDHLLTMNISLPGTRYAEGSQIERFWQQFLERVHQLPGVKGTATTLSLPPNRLLLTNPFTVEGGFDPSRPMQAAEETSISPDYFKTLGVPLVQGRFFTDNDNCAAHVIIINQELARRYFPGQNPLGKRLQTGDFDPKAPWETIIGVVGDVKYSGLDSPPAPQLYVPFNDAGWLDMASSMYVVIRTAGDPNSLVPAVRQALGGVDPDIPMANIATMDQLLGESVAPQRFRTWLLGGFAWLALLLAGVGVYAVISYSVTQRTGEFGVRIALGAQGHDVLRLVLGQAASLAGIGLLIGIVGALALTRTMSSLLFAVSASDPISFVIACAILVTVALLASFIPARRATKVNPVIALRYE